MVVEKWWDISITGFLAFGVWQDVELVMDSLDLPLVFTSRR